MDITTAIRTIMAERKEQLKKELEPKYFNTADELRQHAENYMSHISLGRYVDISCLEGLFDETTIEENPLNFNTSDEDLAETFKTHCKDFMDRIYEKYAGKLEPIDGLSAWQQYLLCFALHLEDDEEFVEHWWCDIVMVPIDGCGMGDELPIGTAVTLINCLATVMMLDTSHHDVIARLK